MDYFDFTTVSWAGGVPDEHDSLWAGEWVDMPLVLTKADRPRTTGRSVKRESLVVEGREVAK